jgi:uncharacterized membrane protein YbhN (UPF0104 family)
MQPPPETARSGSQRPRWRRAAWWIGLAVVAGTAGTLAATHRREVTLSMRLLSRVDLDRLSPALGLEAVSLVSLAALEQWLLRAAGARLRLRVVTGIVAGSNAMAGGLPGGGVLALGWNVRQLQRRQVAFAAAAAALATAGAISVATLVLLLTAGALVAAPSGPAPGLRQTVLVTAAVCAALIVAGLGLSRSAHARQATIRVWRRAGDGNPAVARVQNSVAEIAGQARSLHPSVRGWIRPVLLGLLNWICDAATLLLCLWALGVSIPWRGFLMAYTLTQLLGSLRVTPGSLGVSEASLAALLVLYGLRADQAIAATLLYRGLSFWLLQPVGWGCWLVVTLHHPTADPGSRR